MKRFGVLAAALFGMAAAGDVVRLRGGGKIEGAVIDEDSDETVLVVATKHSRQKIARAKVEAIERSDDPAPESFKAASARLGAEADGRHQLGLWCEQNGLRKEAPACFREALAKDANHAAARAKLGYKLVGDQWKTEAEIMGEQGFVQDARGKWVLPQQKEEADRKVAQKKSRGEFFRKVVAWQKLLNHPKPDRAAEARANLRGLRDPEAVEPLLRYLGQTPAPIDQRILCAESLSGIAGKESTDALVKLAEEDDHANVRGAAIKGLSERKSPALVKTVVAFLKDKENAKVDRAGDVLAEIGDLSAAADLAAALVTTHRVVEEIPLDVAPGRGPYTPYRVETLPNGLTALVPNPPPTVGGGTVIGGAPARQRVREVTHRNEGVLEALKKISGEDFGYDPAKWLDWLRKRSLDKAGKLLKK